MEIRMIADLLTTEQKNHRDAQELINKMGKLGAPRSMQGLTKIRKPNIQSQPVAAATITTCHRDNRKAKRTCSTELYSSAIRE
jgi:hypothetical protein